MSQKLDFLSLQLLLPDFNLDQFSTERALSGIFSFARFPYRVAALVVPSETPLELRVLFRSQGGLCLISRASNTELADDCLPPYVQEILWAVFLVRVLLSSYRRPAKMIGDGEPLYS